MQGLKSPRRRPLDFPPLTRGRTVKRLLTRIDELEEAQAEARRAQEALLAATRALRASEERYALAMRGPNEGLWDWDPRSKELYLSARLLSILGFPSENLHTTSHEWLKLVHPDDRDDYQSTLVRHLKGQSGHFECEYRVRDRAGDYRWVLARGLAVRDDTGQATRMVGSIGDVTERKLREASLKASEARFRSLISAAASIIVLIDGDGLIQEFNGEAQAVFDLSREQAIHAHWTDILGPYCDGFAALLADAERGEEVRDREIMLVRTGEVPLAVSWNLSRSDGGIIAVGTDVTHRRNAAELLEMRVAERTREAEAARRQAELANRAKSEFVANMSHELRTPLNAIIGFSEVMRLEVMGPIGNSHYEEYVRAIHDSGTHLLEVINDILDLAKVEVGQFELHREPTDLRVLVQGAVRLMAESAEKAGVGLECHIGTDVGRVLVDPLRLKQVLLNLLSNAVKFTPAGGRVSVAADCTSAGVVLVVGDTGIGMTPKDAERAMQPFVQVDSSLARRYSGTGLGLPLAKNFVALHGGTMQVKSAPGQGTSVTVRLPG